MDCLLKKLKGNGVGITDPFSIVHNTRKNDDKYPVYDDDTHWRLKKPLVRFLTFLLLNILNVLFLTKP